MLKEHVLQFSRIHGLELCFLLRALFSLLLKIGRSEEDKPELSMFNNECLSVQWEKTIGAQMLPVKKWLCLSNTQHMWVWEAHLLDYLSHRFQAMLSS